MHKSFRLPFDYWFGPPLPAAKAIEYSQARRLPSERVRTFSSLSRRANLGAFLSALVAISANLAADSTERDWLIDSGFSHASATVRNNRELVLENGIVRRVFRLSPAFATVGLENLSSRAALLRAVEPEGFVTLNGRTYPIGGLEGQPDRGYLREEWIDALTNGTGAFRFISQHPAQPAEPVAWRRKRHSANLPWPPPGAAVDVLFSGPDAATAGVTVVVRHEIYDGAPILAKWMTISNGSPQSITLDRFVVESLALVEAESAVDERSDIAFRTPPVDVLSDYMFKGMDLVTGNQVARWLKDPRYTTQVSYTLQTPCRLQVAPPVGPGAKLAPGQSFTTFRSYLVLQDSTDRERQGLTLRHATRILAPWTTENPLMMHVRGADTATFRRAVDQCAEVGFETVIYTFGSGLDMENEDPSYLAKVKEDVDYAHHRGIEVGAYSLFSSRRINDANDVINPKTGRPGGAIFENAPCFGSVWGTNYYWKLTNFIAATGLDLLEHDGPYPGDVCASTLHPGHRGVEDSQWVNWRMTSDLYRWCRERGVYVNQPDYYFLAGGSKTGMGYRESNFSLPRAQQLIHVRQNIYDGTWTKPQTAGWTFVPLTEYQGGGAAATIEPLSENLSTYEGHLANNLGAGVQACWRGPRLYDTDVTKALLKRWVTWYKDHRNILESDIIHGRRADGRDIDFLVQVNPKLATRAMAVVHNPLATPVEREVVLPLYYSGLKSTARVRVEGGAAKRVNLDSQARAVVKLSIPAEGRTWLTVESDRSVSGGR